MLSCAQGRGSGSPLRRLRPGGPLHHHRRPPRRSLGSASALRVLVAAGDPPPSRRAPFPLESFEAAGFPPAGRFLWASQGLTAGTGLKPLDADRDWLEQESGAAWERQLRARRELLEDPDGCGCIVWDDSAAAAAEEVLAMMSQWLPRRYPDRYRLEGTRLVLPTMGPGWSFDVAAARGREALRVAAAVAQEELCLVSERPAADGAEAAAEGSRGGLVHCFDAGAVCFSFDPRARHRKLMAQVHRPVPGYEASMRAAVSRVFEGLAPGRPLWRANWALQNNAEIISTDLPWHPTNLQLGGKDKRASASSSDVFADTLHTSYMDPLGGMPTTPTEAGELMHVRVEYETLRRLPASGWSLFTVHTFLDPLAALPPEAAQSLAAAVAASTDGQLLYKSLHDAELRGLVVEFLATRAAEAGLTVPDGGDPGDPRPARCPFAAGRIM